MKRPIGAPWLAYVAAASIAVGLKAYYRSATVGDLAWILVPTARLVGWALHQPLRQAGELGWLPPDGRFVIAPACAGINFSIVVFTVSVLGFAHRQRSAPQRWAWLAIVAAFAYGLTVAVNAVRIVVAVTLYQAGVQYGWMTPERVHRVAGTIIYLAGLWTAWAVCDVLSAGGRVSGARLPAGCAWERAALVVPLAYLGITVAVPLINGAWAGYGAHYLEHALTVSAIVIGSLRLHSLVRWATSGPSPHAHAGGFWRCGTTRGRHGQADDSGGRRRAGDC